VDGGNNGRPEDIEVHVDDTALASHPDLFKLYGVERWQVGVHVFPGVGASMPRTP
jgi:hypothetical protein